MQDANASRRIGGDHIECCTVWAAGFLLAWALTGCGTPSERTDTAILNDAFAGLNPTVVHGVTSPASTAEVQAAVKAARATGLGISIAGSRKSTGGQQFGTDTLVLDMRSMNRVLAFDPASGLVEVEAGILWSDLFAYLREKQGSAPAPWAVAQKQARGGDFTVGGSLAANIHGDGLDLAPLVAQVESFVLVDADGALRKCSREVNPQFFRAAIGGYGLFGVITTVKLRLVPRKTLVVETEKLKVDDLSARADARQAEGATQGYAELSTDEQSDGFLRDAFFVSYRPVAETNEGSAEEPAPADLAYLFHVDRARAFAVGREQALKASGTRVDADRRQLQLALFRNLDALQARLPEAWRGSYMLMELYVPRDHLGPYIARLREELPIEETPLLRAEVRFVRRDQETLLNWAREDQACVMLTFFVQSTAEGVAQAHQTFQSMVDRAVDMGGGYSLAYQPWSTRWQVLACYPQFPEFLRHKLEADPNEVFQSSWYRHHRTMFADIL